MLVDQNRVFVSVVMARFPVRCRRAHDFVTEVIELRGDTLIPANPVFIPAPPLGGVVICWAFDLLLRRMQWTVVNDRPM